MQSPTNDSEYASPPLRIDKLGRVTHRAECWRPACRAANSGYRTVLHTVTGKAIALCHRRVHDGFGVRVDAWKYDVP